MLVCPVVATVWIQTITQFRSVDVSGKSLLFLVNQLLLMALTPLVCCSMWGSQGQRKWPVISACTTFCFFPSGSWDDNVTNICFVNIQTCTDCASLCDEMMNWKTRVGQYILTTWHTSYCITHTYMGHNYSRAYSSMSVWTYRRPAGEN